jgi:HK97 gp10 family phage protein
MPFKVTGMSRLKGILKNLPKMNEKAVRASSRKAMFIIRDAAKTNAKAFDRAKTPQKIYRNIVVYDSKKRGKAIKGVVMRVGVAGGARERDGGDTWYWRLVEFGHATRGGGHFRGHHFMLRAFSSRVGRVSDAMATYMSEEIARYSR